MKETLLPDTYSFLLEMTARRMKQYTKKEFVKRGLDVTIEQLVLLKMLAEQGNMSQNELAERSFKDAPTVTRIVDLLEKKGYVQRVSDEHDRRKYLVVLTGSGAKKVDDTRDLILEIRAKGIEGITEEELAMLTKTLSKIRNNFKN